MYTASSMWCLNFMIIKHVQRILKYFFFVNRKNRTWVKLVLLNVYTYEYFIIYEGWRVQALYVI